MDKQNLGNQNSPVEPKAKTATPLNKRLVVGLSAGIIVLIVAIIYLLVSSPKVDPQAAKDAREKNRQQVMKELEQQAVDKQQMTDWKTYSSQKFGFEVNYPSAIKAAGIMSENSVLGTYQAPVPGVHIGPLVFVIRQTNADRQFAQSFLDNYLATAESPVKNPDGPSVGCQRQTVNNTAVTAVACVGEGGAAYYALIKGYEYDVFVDGYSRGFGKLSADELGSFEDNAQINQMLSNFKFIN